MIWTCLYSIDGKSFEIFKIQNKNGYEIVFSQKENKPRSAKMNIKI